MNEAEYPGTPDDVLPIRHDLWNRIVWLRHQWREYLTLYGDSAATVALLNTAAPSFFYMIQPLWLDQVMLSVARLVDPAMTGKKENLTLYRLAEVVDHHSPDLGIRLSLRLVRLESAVVGIRDRRNRVIAHIDLGIALGNRDVEPLDPVTRDMIDDAIAQIEAVIDCVDLHYDGGQTAWSALRMAGDSAWLLGMLRDGMARRTEGAP